MTATKSQNELAVANAPSEQLDVVDEKLACRQADLTDAALQFLRHGDGAEVEDIDERRLLWKIDFMIMPFLFGAYWFQYVDKSLVNYAAVMGLQKDTGLSAAQFSYLATFFYVTYAVFQPLHAYLVQKFPVAKYLAFNLTCWGITVTMHCVCKNFGGLIVVRLLLGAFEAAVAPCLILVTGMWYKRAEQPLRMAIWYLGVGLGVIIGALASFGFQFYTSGKTLKSWQIMYLVFGLLTTCWGIMVGLFLPDNPMSSRLSHAEKVAAIERLRQNQTGIENKVFKGDQCKEVLFDFKTWLIVVIILAGNIPTGATGSYSSLLIKSFGYNSKQSALLNIPSGFIQALAVLFAAWAAGRTNNRALAIVGLFLPGILGGGLLAFLPNTQKCKAGKVIAIYLTAIFGPNLSIMYSWASANYAGHTKKITINAIILAAYGASNIIGPLTFTGSTAPAYIPAKVAIMVTLAVAVVTTLVLRYAYVRDNEKRDALGSEIEHIRDVEFMDLTDKQNREFRYAL